MNLTSDKSKALEADIARMKVLSTKERDTYWQLTQVSNPQAHTETVRRVADYSDVKDKAARAGVILTGGDAERAEAARKAEELKLTLDGKPLGDSSNVEETLKRTQRQCAALETAIEFRERELHAEREVLKITYSKTQKPKHDQLMVKHGKAALDFYATWLEVHEFRQHLIDNGVGLRGLCLTLPEFLSTPTNQYSEFADWMRAMKKEGFINSVPKELRL